MRQFVVTPSAGKRLIGKAIAAYPQVLNAAKQGTVVVVAGTTNGYVAQELLGALGIAEDFSPKRFFRGITLPPRSAVTAEGRLSDETQFPGDLVITKGVWQRGKNIFDVAADLKEGDVILKGANALDLQKKQAAVLIGHPTAGTTSAILQAVAGRRVRLIVPVGLEKRVQGDLFGLAEKLNAPGATGFRMLLLPGQVFTELDALAFLTGVTVEVIAGGGVCGAEGSCWLEVCGTESQEETAQKLLDAVSAEPAFSL
jgi:hypothetical protein